MEPASLGALYNAAPIILWVEDQLTGRYLDTVWQHDSKIQIYIGGGHETLEAAVENAYRAGRKCVFSLRDRDFGPSNYSRWTTQDLRKFVLESFEIECFLCDAIALANIPLNTGGRVQVEIEHWLTARAQASQWWMACRKVISDLREARQEYFWKHPKQKQVTNQTEAEQILFESDWRKLTVPALPAKVTEASLRQQLISAHQFYNKHVQTNTWLTYFSCKEVFNELVSWIYTKGRSPGEAGKEDLVKAIAHEQMKSRRVPQEIRDLKLALLKRL